MTVLCMQALEVLLYCRWVVLVGSPAFHKSQGTKVTGKPYEILYFTVSYYKDL